MKETIANEQLKAALKLLAAELESSKNNEKQLIDGLRAIFPFSLYISLRPDVDRAFNGDRERILYHFLQKGINEINLNNELQKFQHELKYKNDQLELLKKEIAILKKELPHSGLPNRQSAEGKETENENIGDKHKTLLDIHLEDTTYSSDKWEHYFEQYEQELANFRHRNNTRLLEIGVQNGGSLQCWHKFLGVNSEIVGIDIDSKTSFLDYDESIKNYVGDATDPDWLNLFCAKEDDFDIIIDDGSHVNDDIIKTFVLLFKKIKPGGLYICEDLHACYWKSHNGGLPSETNIVSALAFFKEIIDNVNAEHWIELCQYDGAKEMPLINNEIEANKSFRLQLSSVESIKFSNSLVFIKKSNHTFSELGSRIVSDKETLVNANPLEHAKKHNN